MNKEKFLKELEKKLAILTESERQDTINEYRDIIEEKVKHGKTEEEAVQEFGSVSELSKEVLKAYKINPEYQNKKSDAGEMAKDFVENTEEFIKKGAKKLSEVTEEVVENFKNSDTEFTTEKAFEIVIKVILVLLALALLKIPFHIIGEIGSGIFHIGFGPFSGISAFAWRALVEVLYVVVCVIIVFSVVARYTKSNKTTTIKKEPRKETVTKVEEKEPKKKEAIRTTKTNDSLGNALLILVKIWVCIIVLFPLWCMNLAVLAGIAFIIYLIAKGAMMIGVLVLLLGIATIGFEICNVIYRLLFAHKRVYPYTFLIGFILIVTGGIMTIDYFGSFTYYEYLPNSKFITETVRYDKHINQPTTIEADEIEYTIDNVLEDGKIILETTYYKDYTKLELQEYDHDIYFSTDSVQKSFNWNRDINDKFITQLKEKEFYDYDQIWNVSVNVISNEKTRELINKRTY